MNFVTGFENERLKHERRRKRVMKCRSQLYNMFKAGMKNGRVENDDLVFLSFSLSVIFSGFFFLSFHHCKNSRNDTCNRLVQYLWVVWRAHAKFVRLNSNGIVICIQQSSLTYQPRRFNALLCFTLLWFSPFFLFCFDSSSFHLLETIGKKNIISKS